MIFHISDEFCRRADGCDLCDVCRELVAGRHYVKAPHDARLLMDAAVEKDGDTRLKTLWKAYRKTAAFKPSVEFQTFLSPVEVTADFPMEKLLYLAKGTAYVLMENGNYEWDVYCRMADIYSRNSPIKNLAAQLRDAMERRSILGRHAGGRDQLLPSYNSLVKELDKPRDWLDHKTVTLFDRDTDDDTCFCGYNSTLFKHFCGKDHTAVRNEDIYTLDQPLPRWHMWYRRSIENYFDKACYADCGMDLSAAPDDDSFYYFKIDDSSCRHYKKSLIGTLADKIGKERLERGLKRFRWREYEFSELQLFLLKLVKII